MDPIASKIFLYVVIVLSASFHEFAHALVAYRLGDPTAKNLGRLTLNPLVHLDPVGTVVIPLFLLLTSGTFIGWAKPVPYNPLLLRDQRYGSLKVGLAGPASNLLIALILGLLIRLGAGTATGEHYSIFFNLMADIILINIFLALFNLIPIPPLDGSKIVMDLFPRVMPAIGGFGIWGIFLALLIAPYLLSPIAFLLFRLITGIPV